jgi:methionyl-tRNA formyltransferase
MKEKENNSNYSSVVFAHDEVGAKILGYLLDEYPGDIEKVIITPNNSESKKVKKILEYYNFEKNDIIEYSSDIYKQLIYKESRVNYDFFYLLWWPIIIPEELISIPKRAVINTHPSLLPYCRGKDPNFWSLVEDVPFGVSIHKVTQGIDDGPIIFQEEIKKSWIDTGETLYNTSKNKIIKLFINSYPLIRKNKFNSTIQDKNKGSFHMRKELRPASEIILEKKYTAKELLNLLRARTFKNYPGCWFVDNNEKYEVSISIKKIN